MRFAALRSDTDDPELSGNPKRAVVILQHGRNRMPRQPVFLRQRDEMTGVKLTETAFSADPNVTATVPGNR